MEAWAFSPSYHLAPLPSPPIPNPSFTSELDRKTEKERQFADWRRGWGVGGGKGQIRRQRESLVIYKSFSTLYFGKICRNKKAWSQNDFNYPRFINFENWCFLQNLEEPLRQLSHPGQETSRDYRLLLQVSFVFFATATLIDSIYCLFGTCSLE
jgi:hypothetical protein